MLNLDTHILLRSLNDELTSTERKLLSEDSWSISDIVLWEITKLSQLKRIELDINSPDYFKTMARIHVWPITIEVCRSLLELDFESDLADEIIAATSIAYHVPLVTRDKKFSNQKLFLWLNAFPVKEYYTVLIVYTESVSMSLDARSSGRSPHQIP